MSTVRLVAGSAATLLGAGMLQWAAGAQAAGDACALLSAAEVAQAVGQPVRSSEPAASEEGTACRFPGATETVVLSLWPTTARGFEELRGTLSDAGGEIEAVQNIGDAAYFRDGRLYVRKGTQALTILLTTAGGDADPNRREAVLAVATAAAAKLQ